MSSSAPRSGRDAGTHFRNEETGCSSVQMRQVKWVGGGTLGLGGTFLTCLR
jgi:hypothetical protein